MGTLLGLVNVRRSRSFVQRLEPRLTAVTMKKLADGIRLRLGRLLLGDAQLELLGSRMAEEGQRVEGLQQQGRRPNKLRARDAPQIGRQDKERRKERPPVGRVRFGDLRRLAPISRKFGLDRGGPIDRYYIETFLARHAGDVGGRVLEIKDSSYTNRYGNGRVVFSDVLDIAEENQRASIVADLTRADHVPSDAFDCIICTQTLHFIYDVRAAVRTLHRILKPGGTLLATFPGISQTGCERLGEQYLWTFTKLSARQLFEEAFPAQNIVVEAHGNVLAATGFLQGLSAKELRKEELEHDDPDYELLIALRAVKPEAGA